MLLRNIPRGDSHDIFTAMSGSGGPTRRSPSPPPPQTYHQDDDTTPGHANNHLDDVWGDDNDHDDTPREPTNLPSAHHPSDMPRLRQEHTTAGYRDGITVAKAKSVQAGFDEGFGLGATIGLRAGELMGVLEGLVNALHSASPTTTTTTETGRMRALLEEARGELSVQKVFGSEYWAEDGTWKYEVVGNEAGTVFSDVAMAHPVLARWDGVVRAETGRWGVDWEVLKGEAEEERRDGHGLGRGEVKAEGEVKGKAKGGLEW
ncbi:hypothetical protein B0T16DRAFT_364192 [Cercophora newfieldiana]|uniref:Protein YAE1 n=1 Tax=Cercophora newfieldiana TaxID=92897 RepID=A0AA39YN84_9PEZI|nr:hypothetical protein B0T16DRAFT_364192 [Cercophora newfieldiana]